LKKNNFFRGGCMLQFYFLSVILNVLTGISLVYMKKGVDSETDKTQELFESSNFKLIAGILTSFTAVMKLLSVLPGDVPVAGDLIPVLAGLAGGITLLLDYYKEKSSVDLQLPQILQTLFTKGRVYVGYACIGAAVLHFLLPKVLFL